MMKGDTIMQRRMCAAITGLILSMMLTGCGGGGGDEPPPVPPKLKTITVTPSGTSIAPSTSVQFTARGTYSNHATAVLTSLATWTSSDPGIATVSSTGLVTAISSTTGSAIITAVYTGVTGSTVLTTSDVVSLSLSPAAPKSLAPTMTQQFQALGTLANSVVQDLTSFAAWLSSAPFATVNASGLATAVTAPGATTISATFSAVTDSVTLTTSLVATIATSPTMTSIALGTSKQFSAEGTLVDGTQYDNLTSLATWSSSNTAVATISNTSPKGLVSSHATGTTLITATFDGVVSSPVSTLVVTPIVLTSIATSPTNTSIALGRDVQYTAIGTFSDSSHQDVTATVTWASSLTSVASISNAAGSKGLAFSHAEGTTTITASASGVTSNNATLKVTPAELASIEVTPASAHVICGGVTTRQFTAMGTDTDGTTKDFTDTANWVSSDTNIITTVNKGFVTVLSCGAVGGSTNITAEVSGITSNIATLTVTFF
jgi:hypothetical protein